MHAVEILSFSLMILLMIFKLEELFMICTSGLLCFLVRGLLMDTLMKPQNVLFLYMSVLDLSTALGV